MEDGRGARPNFITHKPSPERPIGNPPLTKKDSNDFQQVQHGRDTLSGFTHDLQRADSAPGFQDSQLIGQKNTLMRN